MATPADIDPALAAALGRFSQACNYLERQIEFILIRMLPLTTDMGRVLFSGNQMRRNIEIIAALCLLPDVQIPSEVRDKLKSLIPRLTSINDDRSRLLHNPIMGVPNNYYLAVHKQDGKGSAVYPLKTEFVSERAKEAERLWTELYIAPVNYDLSKWAETFPGYPVRDYPTDRPQAGRSRNDRRRNGRRKGEGG